MSNIYKRVNQLGSASANDKVKVTANDTVSGFLEEKLSATAKIILTELNNGANEQLQIDVNEPAVDHDLLLNFVADEHVPKDDTVTTTDNLWSADKIQTELDGKINAIPNPVSDNKLVKSIGLDGINVEQTNIDVDDSNNVTGINNLILDGDLTVNGTTTSVNSETLEVVDANITVNKNGTQASADLDNAGITVEMSDATDVEIGYDSTTTSKFRVGEVGDTREVVTTTHTQEVSNKTINADNNTISELEVDNFKAGVVEIDLNNIVDDTKLASAEAIKEYVAQEIATKDEASEISYDNTTSGLTATEVQSAIDEVEGRLDTVEGSYVESFNTRTGAVVPQASDYDANQVDYDNVASGLVATEVQSAIDEVEARVQTNETDISNHLADAVDAHDATAISYDNTTSGLLATEAQSAIDEVEGRVDTIESSYVESFNGRNGIVSPQASDYDADQVDYDNTTSGLTATNAQAAIDEVEARVDTAETNISTNTTDISNHLADAVDAHDASAISYDNLASGLAATETQAAIDEIASSVGGIQNNLQGVYDASPSGDISLDAALGAINVKDNATPIGAALLSVQDDTETNNYLSVDVDGFGGDGISADEVLISDANSKVKSSGIASSQLVFLEDFAEGSASLLESQVGSNVTGFTLGLNDISFSADLKVFIDATLNKYATYKILGTKKQADWEISIESLGDDTFIDFNINSSGQLIYTSSTYVGFTAASVNYKIEKISI